jgi:hypothetical protein
LSERRDLLNLIFLTYFRRVVVELGLLHPSPAARGGRNSAFFSRASIPRPPRIFPRILLIYMYPFSQGGAPSRGKSASACGTPIPTGALPGRCRRIAVMRRCRHLCHACTQLVARTCATLAPEDFEANCLLTRPPDTDGVPAGRPAGLPAQVRDQSCWRVRVPPQ